MPYTVLMLFARDILGGGPQRWFLMASSGLERLPGTIFLAARRDGAGLEKLYIRRDLFFVGWLPLPYPKTLYFVICLLVAGFGIVVQAAPTYLLRQ
jgi:hypothetical protein